MSNQEGIFQIPTMAGIKRDGTDFDSNYYNDGQWVRFQRGRPRKIGGCNLLSSSLSGPVYGSFIDRRNGFYYMYFGSANSLEMIEMSDSGSPGGIINRTPSGFPTSPNNIWQFDILFDAGGSKKRVIAHAGQNLTAIDSAVQSPIYFGTSDATAALTSTGTSVSGGVFSMPPYMFGLDNDGYALWSPPNTMDFSSAGSGAARIAANKLIKGVRTRGGSGYSPAGLIWSLDELYRVYFIGGSALWEFDYIGDTSLLSSSAVVEYNGQYYWPDQNKFCMFNGTIQDLKNDFNVNFFFDNLNQAGAQQVFGFKNPRYNEIWWVWPMGTATQCTNVLIYNIKDNIWYDTAWFPGQSARSSAISSKMFPYPMMTGLDANNVGKYKLWQHEVGVDIVSGPSVSAIPAQFTTSDMSYCGNTPGMTAGKQLTDDRWTELLRMEPDFVQSGNMTMVVNGNNYANEPLPSSDPFTFGPTTGKIDIKIQRREMTLTFASNVAGGDFQLGKTLLTLIQGDGRQ